MTKDEVIIIEPGAMSEADISRLHAAGFIVVECKDPTKISFLTDLKTVKGDIIFQAAMKALNYGNTAGINKAAFYDELMLRLYPK